jgi:hypothetical protein
MTSWVTMRDLIDYAEKMRQSSCSSQWTDLLNFALTLRKAGHLERL